MSGFSRQGVDEKGGKYGGNKNVGPVSSVWSSELHGRCLVVKLGIT